MTDSTVPPGPRPRRRWPFVLLLLGSLAWLGLLAGVAAGATWWVPEGSGLAGPAIALGYGVLGAAAALVLGAALGWKAPHGLLRVVTAVTVALALLAAGWIGWRIAQGMPATEAPSASSSRSSTACRSASSTHEFMLTPR
jgi:hypothetical protein